MVVLLNRFNRHPEVSGSLRAGALLDKRFEIGLKGAF
jgi:hypothetical protein